MLNTLEQLEPRSLLSAVAPSNYEQYLIELVNRGRADPAAEAYRYGINLNEGLPAGTITTAAKQPLAVNPYITDAARGHSQWMINTDTFAHTGANGTDPGDRMSAAGYVFTGTWSYGENIAWVGQTGSTPNPTTTTAQIHRNLFVDAGYPNRGHRTNLMDPDFKEIGAGIVQGMFNQYNAVMATEDFGLSGSGSFITGVAYSDTVTADDFYTPGEGLGGITVVARRLSDNVTYSTTTYGSGGYSIKVPAGTYELSANSPLLGGQITFNSVTVGSLNVKRDFVSGQGVDDQPPTVVSMTVANITKAGDGNVFIKVKYADNTAIDVSTLGNGDIYISGNGYSANASLYSVDVNSSGTPRTATYVAKAPGGIWDHADNGTYAVVVKADQVYDLSNNSVAAATLGQFTVNVPDTTAPTTALTAAKLTRGGASTYTFTVTYSDATAVKRASLTNGDVLIVGPNNFSQQAKLLSADQAGDALKIKATYQIKAPGGFWNSADNGKYTVSTRASQVSDTLNNYVSAKNIGTFTAAVPAALPSARAFATNLTAGGGADYTFSIKFIDDTGIRVTDIGNDDIVVVGPGNARYAATLLGMDLNTNGTPRIGAFRISAPGGTWDSADNGNYAIWIKADAVRDISGNYIPPTKLKGVSVAIA